METEMKLSIAISALLVTAFVTASTEKAKAEEVYCYTAIQPVAWHSRTSTRSGAR
jgi:hypothetical protein